MRDRELELAILDGEIEGYEEENRMRGLCLDAEIELNRLSARRADLEREEAEEFTLDDYAKGAQEAREERLRMYGMCMADLVEAYEEQLEELLSDEWLMTLERYMSECGAPADAWAEYERLVDEWKRGDLGILTEHWVLEGHIEDSPVGRIDYLAYCYRETDGEDEIGSVDYWIGGVDFRNVPVADSEIAWSLIMSSMG